MKAFCPTCSSKMDPIYSVLNRSFKRVMPYYWCWTCNKLIKYHFKWNGDKDEKQE